MAANGDAWSSPPTSSSVFWVSTDVPDGSSISASRNSPSDGVSASGSRMFPPNIRSIAANAVVEGVSELESSASASSCDSSPWSTDEPSSACRRYRARKPSSTASSMVLSISPAPSSSTAGTMTLSSNSLLPASSDTTSCAVAPFSDFFPRRFPPRRWGFGFLGGGFCVFAISPFAYHAGQRVVLGINNVSRQVTTRRLTLPYPREETLPVLLERGVCLPTCFCSGTLLPFTSSCPGSCVLPTSSRPSLPSGRALFVLDTLPGTTSAAIDFVLPIISSTLQYARQLLFVLNGASKGLSRLCGDFRHGLLLLSALPLARPAATRRSTRTSTRLLLTALTLVAAGRQAWPDECSGNQLHCSSHSFRTFCA
mmetsp:Transcript_33975/g.83270  ORF Transcript_33975/g.83270 Transcript_33975/m.83270 type:complete len:368 (-) Transcript_33975:2-1105(-)